MQLTNQPIKAPRDWGFFILYCERREKLKKLEVAGSLFYGKKKNKNQENIAIDQILNKKVNEEFVDRIRTLFQFVMLDELLGEEESLWCLLLPK